MIRLLESLRLLLLVPLMIFLASDTFAVGFPRPASAAQWHELDLIPKATFDFTGIVSLSNCSGSLVRYDDSEDDDYGMVLTNGHCVRMMAPGDVDFDRSASTSFEVLNEGGDVLGTLRASRLIYATMTDTDMALFRLRLTFADIYDRYGVEALTLSRMKSEIGDDIEIISGYWKRGYVCEVEKFIYLLKEDDWEFADSIRYSRPGCEVIGGTSGSPILLKGTRTVIGVNNTGNQSGRRCTMNNPCEIDQDGSIIYERGYNYGQQISWLYDCRNEERKLDLTVQNCSLPKP